MCLNYVVTWIQPIIIIGRPVICNFFLRLPLPATHVNLAPLTARDLNFSLLCALATLLLGRPWEIGTNPPLSELMVLPSLSHGAHYRLVPGPP